MKLVSVVMNHFACRVSLAHKEDEIGTDQHGAVRVKVDPRYYRPSEVETLLGDASKAERELGWKRQISFDVSVCLFICDVN